MRAAFVAARTTTRVAQVACNASTGLSVMSHVICRKTVRRVLKKRHQTWRRVGWVIPPRRNADFAAGMERVLD